MDQRLFCWLDGNAAEGLPHGEHEGTPDPVPVDGGHILPGHCVGAVRHFTEAHRHDQRIQVVDLAVVQVHSLAGRIQHLDAAESGFQRLREPDDDPVRGRFQFRVWRRLSRDQVGVGRHTRRREPQPGGDHQRQKGGQRIRKTDAPASHFQPVY